MSIITLVSGGLDSTLMSILVGEEGIQQLPLFIDYGQICKEQELNVCVSLHKKYGLPIPEVMDLKGFGNLIPSGLTDASCQIYEDAFLPGRNLMFLLAACAYAYKKNANTVAIGLLSDEKHLFPDQTSEFVRQTQMLINYSMGKTINILTPLMHLNKSNVIKLAKLKNIDGTYSCHSGTEKPCGICVSCIERINTIKELEEL